MNPIKKPLHKLIMITLLSASALNSASAATDDSYLNLAEKLVVLRGQVSDLSSELQLLRDEHKVEMRGLITQKNTASANIKQEEDVLDQLSQSLLENKKLINDVGSDKDAIKQSLLTEVESLRRYVNSSLPFKLEQRLKSINDYESNLNAGILSSHKAANVLWSMIEDELKLARDNGVYRHSVTISGKENLAHVAKIGMVMMYFRMGDDEYGMFTKNGNNWEVERITQEKNAEQVKALFASLEKQVHVGYFELPNTFKAL